MQKYLTETTITKTSNLLGVELVPDGKGHFTKPDPRIVIAVDDFVIIYTDGTFCKIVSLDRIDQYTSYGTLIYSAGDEISLATLEDKAIEELKSKCLIV